MSTIRLDTHSRGIFISSLHTSTPSDGGSVLSLGKDKKKEWAILGAVPVALFRIIGIAISGSVVADWNMPWLTWALTAALGVAFTTAVITSALWWNRRRWHREYIQMRRRDELAHGIGGRDFPAIHNHIVNGFGRNGTQRPTIED